MAKTWGEIRLEALHLGFDKPYNYEKQKDAFIKAFNWAQRHVAVVSGALVGRYKTSVNLNRGWPELDMHELAKRQGKKFIHMADMGVRDAQTGEKIDGWTILDGQFLLLDWGKDMMYRIYYCIEPEPINADTPDSYECELPDKWARIIPYYMANRLYLEDDTEKAGYYWNVAEDMTNHILLKEREPEVSVMGGIDIDGWCC